MSFIQIIEPARKEFDKLTALSDVFFESTEGKRTVERSVITRDRNDPDRYVLVVFFDSYEWRWRTPTCPRPRSSPSSSEPSSTNRPTFHDLDVIEDRA